MKKGKNANYFDGSLTDGTSTMRFVGFTTEQQNKLATYLEAHQPACLINCEVNRSRQGNSFEIILKKFTEITQSQKTIDESDVTANLVDLPATIALEQLPDIAEFNRVSASVKVVFVHDAVQLACGKNKQDVIISDCTAVGRFVLWEDDVDILVEKESYRLNNVLVKEFQKHWVNSDHQ